MVLDSMKWGYVRIITGTILGGVLGFYVMHRLEVSYKEKMKERLKEYEKELRKKEKLNQLDDSGEEGGKCKKRKAKPKQSHSVEN